MNVEKWFLRNRQSRQYKYTRIRGYLLRIALCLTSIRLSEAAFGSWTEQCKQGGQCANMMKSYETLVMGAECRSFYVTGECSRLCTYSLRALISRKMWSRCTKMCEWGEAIVSGAESWLELCQERPARDVQHGPMGSGNHDEHEHVEVHDVNGLKGGDINKVQNGYVARGRLTDKSGRRKRWLRTGAVFMLTKVLLGGAILLLLLMVVSFAPKSALGVAIRKYFNIPRWVKGINTKGQQKLPERFVASHSYSTSVSSGHGPSYSRADSRAQRGARRHLVGAVSFN